MNAQTMVTLAEQARDAILANDYADDWTDASTRARYRAAISSMVFWVAGDRAIAGNVASTRDAEMWAYKVADALDAACADVPGGFPYNTGSIETIPGGARLEW